MLKHNWLEQSQKFGGKKQNVTVHKQKQELLWKEEKKKQEKKEQEEEKRKTKQDKQKKKDDNDQKKRECRLNQQSLSEALNDDNFEVKFREKMKNLTVTAKFDFLAPTR